MMRRRRRQQNALGGGIIAAVVLAFVVFGPRLAPLPERPLPPTGATAIARPRPAQPRPPTTADAPAAPQPTTAAQAAIRWRVVTVHDGDTVWCLDDDKVRHKVRLFGIDAPEIGQPFGTKSRDRLAELIKGREVEVEGHGHDRYGRPLARLEIDGQDVDRQMVLDGMAWHFKRYSNDATLAAAEVEARAARRGLWADRQPMPPWEWRASEKDRKAAAKREPAKR
jgi:micrococcal nuclease